MSLFSDRLLWWLVGAVFILLAMATGMGRVLRQRAGPTVDKAAVEQFNLRIRAWWVLCGVLAAAFLIGPIATVILFGLLSFWALREFITLTPTRVADHRALFWVFFVFTPLQYVLVSLDILYTWSLYGLFSILIPVYGFLFIPARIAWAGDYTDYLERCAKIQAGLMICVYCLSYAPALLNLEIAKPAAITAAVTDAKPALGEPAAATNRKSAADSDSNGSASGSATSGDAASAGAATAAKTTPQPDVYDARLLLFFFILVVTVGDALQFLCERMIGKHLIAPAISESRTWEGFLVGIVSTSLFGTALVWATPFSWLEALGMSFITGVMGFAGGMTMSAIRRDRGVKEYGTLIVGHGGVLDRIDSICFAAPVFYHVTRFLFLS